MKLHHLLIAVAVITVSACTGQAAPKDWIGKELPALGVEYVDKEKPDLKGKPAIVEFWATWCPPCRATIPHLNEINKKYQGKLVVVGITDEDKQTIATFRKANPMEYNVAIDKKDLGQKLGVTGIPHAFLVDKDGKVVWEGHPGQLEDAEIAKVVK